MPVIFSAKLHYFYGISQPFRLFLVILHTLRHSHSPLRDDSH